MDKINENSPYIWQDKKSNGNKNPRAVKKRKITDKEFLDKIDRRDNSELLYNL